MFESRQLVSELYWALVSFDHEEVSSLYLSVDMLPFPLNLTSFKLSIESSCSKVSNHSPEGNMNLAIFSSQVLRKMFLLQSVEGMELVFVELGQATSDPEGSATHKIVKDADRLIMLSK
ncbi:hypothetical protein RHSIM_RhsimUnG0107700 [Rhododendron simsii]|uniref:Uncharacterized protein n=1 Tax=Rhododendron simsii TaxID=118357 RepID=A0A834G1I0_RHOSS|nr:hypothetical protein RHSIM_RhsimUnG0107700 [Rhododendron simsii]